MNWLDKTRNKFIETAEERSILLLRVEKLERKQRENKLAEKLNI
jgi:hypothetical protein